MKITYIKSAVMLSAIPPSVSLVPVVSLEGAVTILIYLFIMDFVSGLLASYFEWKKTAPKGKYFFGQSQGFSSDKFKKCFVKGIIYGGFPIVVLKFQQVFLLKNISIAAISNSEIEVTTVCILVFCANELFSIFWENLPKCGLNIPKLVRNVFTGVKTIKEDINEITK